MMTKKQQNVLRKLVAKRLKRKWGKRYADKVKEQTMKLRSQR